MYSLILVDYNSLEKTVEYAKMCKHQFKNGGTVHVVIVENGSCDGDLQLLSDTFGEYTVRNIDEFNREVHLFSCDNAEICYCRSGDNLGYAKGNNLGICLADTLWAPEYYIISNNDLVFEKAFDLSVVEGTFNANHKIGVIGPKVITPKGELQSPRKWQGAFHRLIFNYWISVLGGLLGEKRRIRIWNKYGSDTLTDAKSGNCAWVSGCFMIARAAAFHKAGMFDEHTFLYAEEMILSERLKKAGYAMYFCRELEVVHKHAETTKKSINMLKILEIEFEANLYFYKTYRHTNAVCIAFAKISFCFLKFLLKIKYKAMPKRG